MKTFLNNLIAVFLLSSSLLSAQSVDRHNLSEYAAKAKAFLKEIEKFDSTSLLRNSNRTLDSTYVYERTDEGNLAHVARILYEFDQLKRIKTVHQFEWLNGKWKESFRADLSYQSSPKTVITIIQTLDEETSELVEFAKETKKSRDDGQVSYYELAIFFGFDYLPFDVTTISYNNQDLPDTIITSTFDLEIFALVPSTRETNTYNSSGQIISTLIENYDLDNLAFHLSELVEYIFYDDNGLPLKITESLWNVVTESWLPYIDIVCIYTYDNLQRVTQKLTYTSYNSVETELRIEEFEYHNTWGEITVYTNTLMSLGILVSKTRETIEFDNEGNIILETQISLESTPEVILGKQQHFYNGFTSSIGSEKKLVFDIRHANPSSSGDAVQITVETTNLVHLTVYDMSGKKMGGKTFQFAENFRLPSLPGGMYVLVLQARGYKPESRKILIK